MKTRNLKKLIRNIYASRIILPAIVLIIAAIVLVINPFDRRNKIVTVDALSDIGRLYSEKAGYIQCTADRLYYTGLDYTVNSNIKARVYYTLENNKCYIFIISSEKLPDEWTSLDNFSMNAKLIRNNSTYDSVIASLARELEFSAKGLHEIVEPTIISQYDYVHSFSSFYFVLILALCILSGVDLLLLILVLIIPTLSPPVIRLRKYGNSATLFAIAQAEFDTAQAIGRKNIYITDTFLISYTKTGIDIIPLENITWIYRYNELHRSGHRTRLYHPLFIVTDCKKTYTIHHVSSKVSDKILDTLQTRFPSILVGM